MTLIIFDLDGTLVYSNRIDSQCFAETYFKIYGSKFPSIDWHTYPHVTDTSIFDTVILQQFGRMPDPEEIERFQTTFVELLVRRRKENPVAFQMVPGAKDLVHYLQDHDHYAVGIATGGWQRPAVVKLDHVGINRDPIFLRGADGLHRREDILETVKKRAFREHPHIQKVVYIGDAKWDITTTRNLGMDFVGIRRQGDHQYLLDEGATQVISDYQDFEAFLEVVHRSTPPAV